MPLHETDYRKHPKPPILRRGIRMSPLWGLPFVGSCETILPNDRPIRPVRSSSGRIRRSTAATSGRALAFAPPPLAEEIARRQNGG